ncbi:MAG: OmpP1/FadL family transporter [Bacteroidota bacterium]
MFTKQKLLLVFILSLTGVSLSAQDITDALRFTNEDLSGTARFMSMSGAFGALGADMSSLKVNPAGSAVFLTNHGSFTLDLGYSKNKTEFGTESVMKTNERKTNFSLPQAGAVFVFKNNDQSSAVNKLSFGLSYERTNNHSDRNRMLGVTNSSIGDYFVQRANGIPESTLQGGNDLNNSYTNIGQSQGLAAQEAYLAYQSYLINPEEGSNNMYASEADADLYYNDMIQSESGMNGKMIFNGGVQMFEKLYLGLNLNAHFVNYDRFTSYFEQNSGGGEIQEVLYENDLRTRGSGFSFQLGAIYNPVQSIRIGASYQSPTWFTIDDELTQGIETYSEEFGTESVFPNVINVFPEYRFRSPSKATGSFAYVFGRSGLISIDYTYQDFSSQKFTSAGFDAQNMQIKESLQATSNINIGGEYKLAEWSFRGGYHFMESPYRNDAFFGDSKGYSFGLGYSFGNTKLDFAYRLTELDKNEELIQTGLDELASVNNKLTNFVLTLSFGI